MMGNLCLLVKETKFLNLRKIIQKVAHAHVLLIRSYIVVKYTRTRMLCK
jgi:hypothetical protein